MKVIQAQGLSLSLLPEAVSDDPLAIAGVRHAELRIANAAVELGTSDEHGWRRYLPRAGTRSLSLRVRGIVLNKAAEERLKVLALTGAEQSFLAELEGGMRLQGPFIVGELIISDQQGDEPTFEFRIESSGVVSIV